MNTLLAVIIGALTVYLAYTLYARRIDRHVIQSDPKRATPATLYMDGVDFMPTNRNILFGYHFKSIAAAGPIVGAIVAATLWGWLPAMIGSSWALPSWGGSAITAPSFCPYGTKDIAFRRWRTV